MNKSNPIIPDFNNIRRESAENEILFHLRKIYEIAKEYAPNDDYLILTILGANTDTPWIHFNNCRKTPDEILDMAFNGEKNTKYSSKWTETGVIE